MLLTRLYRHVMEYYPHLDNGIYNVFDQVMRPLALKQTQKPRSDRGKARHSVSSTSAHHNYGSSSHQGDDDEDDGAFRASTPSPTTYLNSLQPLNYQRYDIPTSSQQDDNLLFERQTTLLNQSQQMHEEVRGGKRGFQPERLARCNDYLSRRGISFLDLGLEVGSIRRIQWVGYGVLEFLGVGTTFDIFQNILFPYIQYGVLVFSGYGVLIFIPLWSLVRAGTDTPYLP
ncbi:hypothetical protein Tco_1202451 [Tanacetum coccineum]